MAPADVRADSLDADVCLVLEGAYPYVKGGVSTWVHQLMLGLPDVRFAVVHIGPEPGTYTRRLYSPPANVTAVSELYCREPPARGRDVAALLRRARGERHRHSGARRPSRVLEGIRRLHLGDRIDPSLLDDLASHDLPPGAFLHGRASFEVMSDLCEQLAPEASFLSFFWHFRSMHLPLVRLLGAEPPRARVYHALCTGYAGILAAVWSLRTGRPLLLTEHGIYARERALELDRADWLRGTAGARRVARGGVPMDAVTAAALRGMWVRFFRTLARCAYARASAIVSLSGASQAKQIADGAPTAKTLVVPNGIDLQEFHGRVREPSPGAVERRPVRVGFVGRLVPIKDVVTLIRACFLALRTLDLDVRIFGPADEDPSYARRCRRLVAKLGLERAVRFEASRPIERIYPEIDILVLTSFSEGQPLVILEAGAAGIPVVATDVGACRELLEGREEEDRSIGPSGIVTPLSAPENTAEAILRLARDARLRRLMGEAGRKRVAAFYRQSETLSAYRSLYAGGTWRASAGASSA